MGARFEGKNLRIGVIGEDVQFPLLPPMARIYAEVEKKVSAAGHTLIHLQLPANNLSTTTITAVKSFSQDPSSVPFQHIAASGFVFTSMTEIKKKLPEDFKDHLRRIKKKHGATGMEDFSSTSTH